MLIQQSTDEQKLIYSGQLLSDAIVLKDVLRQYEEHQEGNHQIHTVHLVYTPKMNPKSTQNKSTFSSNNNNNSNSYSNTSNRTLDNNMVTQASSNTINSSSTDGLRQRHVVTNQSVPVSVGLGGVPVINYGIGGNVMGSPNLFDFQQHNTSLAVQQQAMQTWMQTAYSQYLNQYISL